jgi:hypothetical protein
VPRRPAYDDGLETTGCQDWIDQQRHDEQFEILLRERGFCLALRQYNIARPGHLTLSLIIFELEQYDRSSILDLKVRVFILIEWNLRHSSDHESSPRMSSWSYMPVAAQWQVTIAC